MECISRTAVQVHDNNGTRSFDIAASQSSSVVPEVTIDVALAPQTDDVALAPQTDLFLDKRTMKKLCVPLQKAILRGDWEDAKRIIDQEPRILTSSITHGGHTVLHLAAGTKNVPFVKQLVDKLSKKELEFRDNNGNTALCHIVATAPVEIADIMLEKNPCLVSIRGGCNMLPLYMAAQFKRSEMAWSWYDRTKECFDENDPIGIFFWCINNAMYDIAGYYLADLALKMLKDYPSLAKARDDDGKTALHHLAETPSAFADSSSSQGWTKIAESCLNVRFRKTRKQTPALELVTLLWDEVLNLSHEDAMDLISSPSPLLIDATKLGNYEFLQLLVSTYPDLVWEHDDDDRTIIQIAVQYRHANLFNLIHHIGSKKDIITTYEDKKGNNILHLAAMLPPSDRHKTVSGAALQMHKELLWFQEVEKVVTPFYANKRNKDGENPRELFSSNHKQLLKEGEKWMKDTSNSGLIVSTILTTVLFAAAFSLPGGNNNSGTPNDIKYIPFMIFVLSDGLAMLLSVVASLMFLSILTSRYTEYDFLESLPLKLMIGLTSLFFSMASTMVAFSFTIAMACRTGFKWVPYLISAFSFIPIALFFVSQFPLWFDTFRSIYWSRTIFQPPRQMALWFEKSNFKK